MKIIDKDITTISDGIIAHQVNCFGSMRSGVAKSISEKFPTVRSEYIELCSKNKPETLLGTFQTVVVNDSLKVLNCFSQLHYGRDGKLYTNYSAIDKIFENVSKKFSEQLYLPFLYGCGLGNGDWEIVSKLILKNCPEVIFCKFGGM